jgi:hypothetical protein
MNRWSTAFHTTTAVSRSGHADEPVLIFGIHSGSTAKPTGDSRRVSDVPSEAPVLTTTTESDGEQYVERFVGPDSPGAPVG